jgi:hypothetical protein
MIPAPAEAARSTKNATARNGEFYRTGCADRFDSSRSRLGFAIDWNVLLPEASAQKYRSVLVTDFRSPRGFADTIRVFSSSTLSTRPSMRP